MTDRILSISIAVVIILIVFSVYETTSQILTPPYFDGCYVVEGKRAQFTGSSVHFSGTRVGSFRMEKGDATKGPDWIVFTPSRAATLPETIDTSMVWYPRENGMLFRLKSGAYLLAPKCNETN